MNNSSSSFLLYLLELSADELRKDLDVLKTISYGEEHRLVVAHDEKCLIVHARASKRAYIPKRYGGFDVKFREWVDEDHGSEIPMPLDYEIY